MAHQFVEYDKILDDIYSRILVTDQQQKQVIYAVPKQITAKPGYTLKACLVFIIKKLRDNDYLVTYRSPNLLIVDVFGRRKKGKSKKGPIPIVDKTIIDIVSSVKFQT